MARPEPLHGRMESRTIRFWQWLRHATDPASPGGTEIVHDEAIQLVDLWHEDVPDRHLMTSTMRHIGACVGGGDGMDSYRAETSWNERQYERAKAETTAFVASRQFATAAD